MSGAKRLECARLLALLQHCCELKGGSKRPHSKRFARPFVCKQARS